MYRVRPTSTRAQVTAIPAHSDAEQTTVMVACDGGVGGVDLLIEAFPQAPVGIADHK
jgi:hypothetical protein